MFSLKIHHQTLISWISSIRRPLHQIPHNKWDGVFSTNLKLSDWSSSASQLGKKLAAAFQHQTEVFNLKGSWWRFDIFSCTVNPFWGLTLCTTLTIFFYPASCEKPSAPSSSVGPARSPVGILAGSGMMVQAAIFSTHLQSRHRAAVHLPLKLERKEKQKYSESADDAKYWGLVVVGFFCWLQVSDHISCSQNHVSEILTCVIFCENRNDDFVL